LEKPHDYVVYVLVRVELPPGGPLLKSTGPDVPGIWWYARFPNHYSGHGSLATTELGQFKMNAWIDGLVKAIRAVKADQESLKLQNEFCEKAKHTLDTRP
jgi:hypothetical protein